MSRKHKQIQNLYQRLKSDGMFNMVLGSCISSDNADTKETWMYNKHILQELLPGIPPSEREDIERVQKGLEIIRQELEKF